MSKRVYISSDYADNDGDVEVVFYLHKWGKDNSHKVDFVDMAQVASGSVSNDPDCRPCDLKREFNSQIAASSAVIFIVGNRTKDRSAGSTCYLAKTHGYFGPCTPYKQNTNSRKYCKITQINHSGVDIPAVNNYSYLRHEFEEAVALCKNIIIVYNSLRKEESWLPGYMLAYGWKAQPFWKKDFLGNKVGNYDFIKKALGYE